MATGSIKYCDVFKTANRVKTYLVQISEVEPDGSRGKSDARFNADLCPRALERLKAFIKRGLTPPSERIVQPKLPLESATDGPK